VQYQVLSDALSMDEQTRVRKCGFKKQTNWWTEAVEKEKHTNRDADDYVLKWLFAQHKNYVQSLTSKPTY